jgi:hypothetical protein
VSHTGSTAGYRAHLVRYPDQHTSVAVLCNVSSAESTYAHAVADLYLHDRLKPASPPTPSYTLTGADIDRVAGRYRNTQTGVAVTFARDGESIRLNAGPRLIAASGTHFVTEAGQQWDFGPDGRARSTDRFGSILHFERTPPANTGSDELRALAGTYVSDEAETSVAIATEGTSLVLKRRPDTTLRLRPLYEDAFDHPEIGVVRFRRDSAGRPIGLSVVQDRVWDLQFKRQN